MSADLVAMHTLPGDSECSSGFRVESLGSRGQGGGAGGNPHHREPQGGGAIPWGGGGGRCTIYIYIYIHIYFVCKRNIFVCMYAYLNRCTHTYTGMKAK